MPTPSWRPPTFNYCPICAATLTQIDGQDGLWAECPACGWRYFPKAPPGSGAVVLNGRRILLVRRNIEPRKGGWSLPAGFSNYGEDPADTAVREVREETGIDIRLTGPPRIYIMDDDPRGPVLNFMYPAEVVGGKLAAGEDAAEAAWFGLSELPILAFASHQATIDTFCPGK